LDFFGHQLVLHKKDGFKASSGSNPVDGHDVPIPHFGVVLEKTVWNALSERLKKNGQPFIIEPYIRFEGQVGEQATMFFEDPEGNALEFKSFGDLGQLFSK
jgi:extradiol dioxygenase family protein